MITKLVLLILRPQFLMQVDHHLLINHPKFWVTKFHFVLYYGLFANIFLNLFAWVTVQPRQYYTFVTTIVVIIMLVEAGCFCFWFYKQSQFSVEKEYGDYSNSTGYIEVLLFIVCAMVIVSPSMTVLYFTTDRIAEVTQINVSSKCDLDSSFSLTFGDENNRNRDDACKILYSYINQASYDTHRSNNQFQENIWWHIVFAIVGILAIKIIKHSSWLDFAFVAIYLLLLATIGTLIVFILNVPLDIETEESFSFSSILIILFLFVQIIMPVRFRYKLWFRALNFMTFPIGIALIVASIGFLVFSYNNFSFFKDNGLILLSGLFLYFILTPLITKIYNHLLSLPKE